LAQKFDALRNMKSRIDEMRPYVRRKTDAALEQLVREMALGRRQSGDLKAPYLDGSKYRDLMLAYVELDKDAYQASVLAAAEEGVTLQAAQKARAVSIGNGSPMFVPVPPSESDGVALGQQFGFISQYAGLGPVENHGGIAGLAERLQRVVLGVIETRIRAIVATTLAEEAHGSDGGAGGDNSDDNTGEDGHTSAERLRAPSANSSLSPTVARKRATSSMMIEHETLYKANCKALTSEQVVAVYLEACEAIYDIMHAHHIVVKWHTDDEVVADVLQKEVLSDPGLLSGFLASRAVIWQCAQDRLSSFLRHVNISYPAFRLDYAVQLYHASRLLTHHGELFVGGDDRGGKHSQPLMERVTKHITTYFDSFIKDTFEMLTDFIRREAWTRLDLSLEDMGGVDGLVGGRRKQRFATEESALLVRLWKRTERQPVQAFGSAVNPFAAIVNVGLGEEGEGGADDGDDNADVDSMDDENGQNLAPFKPLTSVERVITTSSLNGFTKYIGSFLNFMEQLPVMASRASAGLFQLFNFYVLSVLNIFVRPARLRALLGDHNRDDTSGPAWAFRKLRKAMLHTQRLQGLDLDIAESKTGSDSSGRDPGAGGSSRRDSMAVRLSEELSNPEQLFGIAKVCNATESVRFLLEMCQALRVDIMRSLPRTHRSGAQALYASAEAVTSELRSFMYGGMAARLLPIGEVTEQMKGLKWDPRDLPESFHPYVTQLLTRMTGRLLLIRKPDFEVPEHLHTMLWREMVSQTMRALLESFSQIKKCTNNGRAQMSLDLSTLQRGIDKEIPGSSSCRAAEIANGYIKAYYYDAVDDFCAWLQAEDSDFQGLALRHALSLIGCEKSPLYTKLKKKQRATLRQRVEQLWRLHAAQRLEAVGREDEEETPPPPPPRPVK
jgi:hypothetical protein